MNELRYAARTLARRPVVSACTILILATALAAAVVVLCVADAVWLRPPPYRDAADVVMVYALDLSPAANPNAQRGAAGAQAIGLSLPDLEDMRRQSRTLAGFAAITPYAANLTGRGDPVRVRGASVSPEFFEVLGVAPLLGGAFAGGDDALAGDRAVILTRAFWMRQLGGDARIVGGDVVLDGLPYRVRGVLPDSFESPTGDVHELYRAVRFRSASTPRDLRFWPAVARLNGQPIEAARAELTSIAADLARRHPESNARIGAAVYGLGDLVPRTLRLSVAFLLVSVLLVLAVTCANLASLQIADAIARTREASVRIALGASSWRVLRESLAEGLLLAGAGGAAGMLLAAWALELLPMLAPPIPRLDRVSIDAGIMASAAAVTVAVGVLLGLVPWVHSLRSAPSALGSRVIGSRRQNRWLRRLVVGQIALALVLVGASGLTVVSLRRLSSVDPGFRSDGVLTFHVPLPRAPATAEQSAARFSALRSRIAEVEGVDAVGATLQLPLAGLDVDLTQLVVDGAAPVARDHEPSARLHVITPGYFRAIGVPVIEGRDFQDADTAETPGVIIVNEAAARRLWAGGAPLGRRLTQRLTFTQGESPTRIVVGVVRNVKHFGLEHADEPQIYVPHAQSPWPAMHFAVRSALPLERLVPAVRRAVRHADPALPVDELRTLDDIVDASSSEARFRAVLVTLYSIAAASMAFLGLYGVLGHSVARRTREIGVRMAVGATRGGILRMVFNEGGRSALAGTSIGMALLLVTSRVFGALLFAVSALEPIVLVTCATAAAAGTLAACALPALRAARLDPVEALRSE